MLKIIGLSLFFMSTVIMAANSSKADIDFQKSYDNGRLKEMFDHAYILEEKYQDGTIDDTKLEAFGSKIALEMEKHVKAGSNKAICELAYYYRAEDSGSIYHRDSNKEKKLLAIIKNRKIKCEY